MKALSIKPPWIELIVEGRKTIETRTWRTGYRGPIVLCSSRSIDQVAARHFGYNNGGVKRLMPLGHALAIAELIDCRTMNELDVALARCPFHPSLYSWVLARIQPLEPFPVRGRLGLFEVDLVKEAYG
jgi:hypothetical protein